MATGIAKERVWALPAAWSVALLLGFAVGCGGADEAPAASNGQKGSTGNGAASLHVAQCDPALGWQSAVKVATGAKDPAALQQFAAALSQAGYRAKLHLGADAATPDGGSTGDADAGSSAPADAAAAAEDGQGAADAGASDDALSDAGSAGDPSGDAGAVPGADAATAVDAGGDPSAVAADPRRFVIATDPRQDAVILMENGDLFVSSACAIDRLGQVRRLDAALAQAAQLVTHLDHPGDWKLETQRWARPDAFYTAAAGQYWRQYLHDAVDLQKPLQGTISLAAAPLGLALGVYGHADVPSAVGDVVRLNALKVAGLQLAAGETWPVSGMASLVWDLAKAMAAGELAFRADLLVADAAVEWKVGVYHVFFEALFGKGGQGLGVSTQGALPGQLRVSKAIAEAQLPAIPPDL